MAAAAAAAVQEESEGRTGPTVMKWKTVLVLFTLVLSYLVAGGAVFQALEQHYEASQHEKLEQSKTEFLRKHTCVQSEELEELFKSMTEAISAGVSPLGSASNQSSHWELGSAFFFAGTVITTIGFGNIAPSTKWGRIFCIIYALLGIPLFGFLLAGVGDQLGTVFGKIIHRTQKAIVHREIGQTRFMIFSTIVFVLAGCVSFVVIPTAVFMHMEEWTMLESLYFVVVTLSTIGFGDYVAGGSTNIQYKEWYKPLVWFWILVGLAYFAAVLSMISDWLRVLSRKTRKEAAEFRAHAAEWRANVTAEIKETHRRLSVEIHDKLQRASSIRSIERRHHLASHSLRRHSMDVLTLGGRTQFRGSLTTLTNKAGSVDRIPCPPTDGESRIQRSDTPSPPQRRSPLVEASNGNALHANGASAKVDSPASDGDGSNSPDRALSGWGGVGGGLAGVQRRLARRGDPRGILKGSRWRRQINGDITPSCSPSDIFDKEQGNVDPEMC